MAQFYKILVSDVYKETDDCSVITFDIPEALHQEFAFRQGQHLTLKTTIDGAEVRRSYSLCSSPVEQKWQVAVKQVPGGLFSTFVNTKLKPGDSLEVMPPSGKFGVEVGQDQQKKYVLFAAGSGITPILSMIKTHLALEPKARVQLFYLNRTVKSIIFKEEIEQLRNQYFGRFEICYFLTKEQRDIELFNGRFTADKLNILTKTLIDVSTTDEVFICGPEEMIFLIRDSLVAAGLSRDKVHYELFVSGLTEADKKRMARLAEQQIDGVEMTIIDGGKEFHFTMTDDFDNILDAALDAGADLPFACKGGVCSTCKCKVEAGDVEMKVNYALEPDEVAQQLVLSCQAVPTTAAVKVNFDV